MEFVDKKIPQVEFDNIHTSILSGTKTDKAERVLVNGYGALSANDEATNNFHYLIYICTIYNPGRYGIRWTSIGIWRPCLYWNIYISWTS